MTDDGRQLASPGAYRGFLFADMRGFTAFADRHGNAAAAAMVARFLDIARTAIERHGGTEMTTEGDAIHAVFQSASSAVLAGLDIVEGAADVNAREPGQPLGLGVGVHAGEAVETAEGYIGRAVNIAARLCAVAKAGEVLVSSTVKGITQSSIPVGFLPRGRRRFKGIHDPILVYAVTRDMTVRASRELPPHVLNAAAVVAGLLLVVLSTIGGVRLVSSIGSSAVASASAVAAATAQPVAIGRLPIGSYASQAFEPGFTFQVGDLGWTANRDVPDLFGLLRDSAPRGSLVFARVREVIPTPCGVGEITGNGIIVPDVLAQLQAVPHLKVSDVTPVVIGGAAGEQADVTVDEGAQAACGGLAGADIAVFRAGSELWSASPGERFRVIAVSIHDQPVTILVSLDWTEAHSVQELEDMLQLGARIVETARF